MANKRQDNDPQKPIKQMINFIKQEATEKADEIRMKADEEFQIEKGRILNPERVRIKQEYDKKFKQLQIEQRIEFSKRINESRLQVLKEREKFMKQMQDKTFEKVGNIRSNKEGYKKLMLNLIIQGLIRMDEKIVEVQVMREDVDVARAVYEEAARQYIKIIKEQAKRDVTVDIKVDESDFLPAGVVGGVMLKARKGKIVLDNTLQSRLKVATGVLVPILRGRLFGVIPHQGVKYDDEHAEESGHH